MSVVSLQPYSFPPKDALENFPAPLLFIGWDQHLMFSAPVALPLPPDTPFGTVGPQVLAGAYGFHPDFARIDWSQVEWLKSGQPWKPDPARSLAENGLRHKDVIRFRTPGLSGLNGTCN